MSKPIHLPINLATNSRPLDLSSLLDAHPEHENHALLDLIGANVGASGAGEYAACDALRFLASAWNDDAGQNRNFVVQTLADTIGVLQRMQTVVNNVIIAQDCLDTARDLLVSQPVAQASSRVRDLLAAHDTLVSESGFKPEEHAALVGFLFPHVRSLPKHAAHAEPAEVTP